jgi:hypothetical protein
MTNHTTLPSGQIVFDPRGAVTAATVTLAPRVGSLDGIRLGVLDNSKWNASKLLRRTVALVETEATPSAINRYTKESFSRLASPQLLDQIAAENDVAITAIGD